MGNESSTWVRDVFEVLRRENIRQVSYVPDAGLAALIELCRSEKTMLSISLTNEEEGIGLAAGAWLGGDRAALLMQSSGVGKCVNALAMIEECRFPLLALVSMRGEWGEANPWQVPMARAAQGVLEAMGVRVLRVTVPDRAGATVAAASRMAFESHRAVAIFLSQEMLGAKSFESAEASRA